MERQVKVKAKSTMRTTTSKKSAKSVASKNKKQPVLGWHKRLLLMRYSKPILFALIFAAIGSTVWFVSAASAAAGPITGVGNKCLDVRGNGHFNGNVVWLWDCNGSGAQTWTMESDQSIRNQDWCLDIPGASKASGTAVQLWQCNGSGAQKWVARSDGSLMNPNSGLCLDDEGAGTANGNVVQTWSCNGGAAQKWNVPKSTVPPVMPPGSTPEPTGPIVGIASKCVDISANSRTNGNRIQLWTCHGGAAQQWTIKTDGTIRNGDWCLNVKDGALTAQTPVVLWQCNGSGAQKWTVTSNGSLVNPQSNMCLDDQASGTTDGNLIWIWACNGTAAQKWTLPGATTPAPTPDPVPGPTPTPTPTPGSSVSGEAMPVGNLTGWTQIFSDDFTKDAATGSWGSECDSSKVVYTGDRGGKWVSYPNCFKDTYQRRPYRADQVLSVHNGSLDFFLHNVNGQPAGANPSPMVTGSSQYQTYGRYSARVKVDPGLSEYYAAWLLWPSGDGNGSCAESDFPEGHLNGTVSGFAHHCGGQDVINGGGVSFSSGWHTYTQDWTPGKRTYYIDGKQVGQSTNQIWSQPERWQLQTETNGNGNHAGHLLVDWVTVYKRS